MSRIATVRRRGLGVLFLAVVVGLLYLSILFYGHFFTSYVHVTLYAGCQAPPAAGGTGTSTGVEDAADVSSAGASGLAAEPVCAPGASTQDDSAGHQLDVPADVKLRGILVGTVNSITLAPDDRRAVLHLELNPADVDLIPANVSAEIVPKTLFGEKYVDLVVPANPSPTHVANGGQIVQSATSIEAEQVFNDFLPLLQTLQPAALATTLSNFAEALQGRGNLLGENLAMTDEYFADFNPDLPTVTSDVGGLETLADSLNNAAPDILAQARQFSVNARTLVQKGDVFADFLSGTEGFAATATQILTRNATNLVSLARVSTPTLSILAEYSPEYSCLLTGLADQATLLKQAISPHGSDSQYGLHINLDVPKDTGRVAYTTADTPKNTAQNPQVVERAAADAAGAPCYGLPGMRTTPIQGKVPINGTPQIGSQPAAASSSGTTATTSSYLRSDVGTTPDAMARLLLAPQLRTSGQDVPDLDALLLSPALAGSAVSVSSGADQ